jgi:hypothetical protein
VLLLQDEALSLSLDTASVAQHCKSTLFFPKEQRKREESCCPAMSSSNFKIKLYEGDNVTCILKKKTDGITYI